VEVRLFHFHPEGDPGILPAGGETRKIKPTCGFSMTLLKPSMRLLPGRSGTTRWVSSSTSTKPAASPLGETSHWPAAFEVARSRNGEAAINARECSSRDE
jgi:hypothetical protein